MDKNDKLERIRALMADKKTQEDTFQLKVRDLNDEIYLKEIQSTTNRLSKFQCCINGKII